MSFPSYIVAALLFTACTKAPESDDTNSDDTDTNTDTETNGLGGVFVTVHCDPHEPPTPADNTHWLELEGVVSKADETEIKLNILLSHPWTKFINNNPSMQSTLADWVVLGGHQIGWHHHDVTHAAQAQPRYDNCAVTEEDWDANWKRGQLRGWAQLCEPVFDPDIGFSEMFTLEAALTDLGVSSSSTTGIHVGCHGTESAMRNFEWRTELQFSQSSANDDLAATVSHAGSLARIACRNYGGQDIPEFGSNPFVTVNSTGPDAEAVREDLGLTASDHFSSVSFHPSEYTGDGKAQIDSLFEVIQSDFGPNQLVSEVLSALDCP
jgi:hypothetical protein